MQLHLAHHPLPSASKQSQSMIFSRELSATPRSISSNAISKVPKPPSSQTQAHGSPVHTSSPSRYTRHTASPNCKPTSPPPHNTPPPPSPSWAKKNEAATLCSSSRAPRDLESPPRLPPRSKPAPATPFLQTGIRREGLNALRGEHKLPRAHAVATKTRAHTAPQTKLHHRPNFSQNPSFPISFQPLPSSTPHRSRHRARAPRHPTPLPTRPCPSV